MEVENEKESTKIENIVLAECPECEWPTYTGMDSALHHAVIDCKCELKAACVKCEIFFWVKFTDLYAIFLDCPHCGFIGHEIEIMKDDVGMSFPCPECKRAINKPVFYYHGEESRSKKSAKH